MQEPEQALKLASKPARRVDTPRPNMGDPLDFADLIRKLDALVSFSLQTESPPPLHCEVQFTGALHKTPKKSTLLGKRKRDSVFHFSRKGQKN
jgi:hypothetical protein